MEEDEDFLVNDLENVSISNILKNSILVEKEKVILKIPEIYEEGNEVIEQNNNRKQNLLKKKRKKKINIDEICQNFTFAFFICIAQSSISIVLFYLYYKYQFAIENTIIFIVVEITIFVILLMVFVFIWININNFAFAEELIMKCGKCSIKFGNYNFLILMAFSQFILELFIYLLTTLDKAQLTFPYFEVRAYWKVSMCLFFLITGFFTYSRIKEDELNLLYMLFSIGFICLIIFISLLILTKKYENNSDSFYYIIAIFFELLNSIGSIIFSKNREHNEFITWRASEIIGFKNYFFLLFYIIWILYIELLSAICGIEINETCNDCKICCCEDCETCRCCIEIIKNYN